MNELVKLISQKTGVDEATAREIVRVVTEFLEKVLPAPLNREVDKLLSGQVTDISQIAGMSKQGGGLLNKLFGGGRK